MERFPGEWAQRAYEKFGISSELFTRFSKNYSNDEQAFKTFSDFFQNPRRYIHQIIGLKNLELVRNIVDHSKGRSKTFGRSSGRCR